MESDDRKEEIESKCRLNLDVGKYLEGGEFKLQTERDWYDRLASRYDAVATLELIVNLGNDIHFCGLYLDSPEPERKWCRACPLYLENKNDKNLGNNVYHPQSLVISKAKS